MAERQDVNISYVPSIALKQTEPGDFKVLQFLGILQFYKTTKEVPLLKVRNGNKELTAKLNSM